MANSFCCVLNVVCVINVCPDHAVDLELIDSAWVVIVAGQICIKPLSFSMLSDVNVVRSKINQIPYTMH